MKKTIMLLLALTVIIGVAFGVDDANAKNTDFEYVITPESPEWRNYNVLELKDKLNIPIEQAESMDTETLLNVVLDYPFLGDIYAFDNPLSAINFLAEQFNGLKVLVKRKDFKDKLINSYIDSSDKIMKLKDNKKTDNEEVFKQKYRETLLAYPTVFNKLSKIEKDTIISKSKRVATKIDTNSIEEFISFRRAPGDIIRRGTVYTPNRSRVPVFELQDMTSADKARLDDYMDSRYPKATRLRSATYKYNCHSYAWYSTSYSNTWWMNNPSKYMTDGSYNRVYTPRSGQKIYYPKPGNEHSGIITSVINGSIMVTSKWGACGLYRHSDMNCPYSSTYKNTYWD